VGLVATKGDGRMAAVARPQAGLAQEERGRRRADHRSARPRSSKPREGGNEK